MIEAIGKSESGARIHAYIDFPRPDESHSGAWTCKIEQFSIPAIHGATPDQAAELAIRCVCNEIARPAFFFTSPTGRQRVSPSRKERLLDWTLWWVTPPAAPERGLKGLPGCTILNDLGVSLGSFLLVDGNHGLAIVGHIHFDDGDCVVNMALESTANGHHELRRFLQGLILSNRDLMRTGLKWARVGEREAHS